MEPSIKRDYSRTFLDEMTLGDEEIDDWVGSALGGSQDFVNELLEIGEDSLEFSAAEEELRKLYTKLNDAEIRESKLNQVLHLKDERISHLEDVVDQLKKELFEERSKAKDEAEDMAQEMAELRYQLTEMFEEERQLRARTEQVSVHRVEELEAQVKQAQQEVVAALARREAEFQADKEIQKLRASLHEVRQQLRDTQETLSSQEVESVKQGCNKCDIHTKEVAGFKEELSLIKNKLEKHHIYTVKGIPNEELIGNVSQTEALEERICEVLASELELEVERCALSTETAELKELVEHYKQEVENLFSIRSEEIQQLEQSAEAAHNELERKFAKEMEGAMGKLSSLEDENQTVRKALELAESRLSESTIEKHALQEHLQLLSTGNSQLVKKVGELSSEVMMLQQHMITCQTQVSEMAMKNVILEDTVLAKKKRIKEGEETILRQAEKLGRQEEKYFNLQAKFSALQNDFEALETKLRETRRREEEMKMAMERLKLELRMAKEEVVKSEVRLQKALKQAKEQVEEELTSKHKQTVWFLNRKIEHLERSGLEKQELRRLGSAAI